jgi:hypothetical protein
MPLQNRVTPEGNIIATADRGTMMGNRGGQLHTVSKVLTSRRWTSRQWICCRLNFNGRRRKVMAPNRYTELFFLDEATAFAAGHRPCFECRRHDFLTFASLWSVDVADSERARALEMDLTLHTERLNPDRSKRIWRSELASLAPGVMVLHDGAPHLWFARRLLRWSPAGYVASTPVSDGASVDVLTPPSIARVLSRGYPAGVHPSAQAVMCD